MKEELVVRRIADGTVIDHIQAGRALRVLKLLGITGERDGVVALVMNVPSLKLGKKDIVKVEGRELSKEEVDKIALISPKATINIIRNYEVVEKRRVELPDRVIGILKCMNPNCVTNIPRESVEPAFTLLSRGPLRMVCEYCGEYLTEEEIVEQLSGV